VGAPALQGWRERNFRHNFTLPSTPSAPPNRARVIFSTFFDGRGYMEVGVVHLVVLDRIMRVTTKKRSSMFLRKKCTPSQNPRYAPCTTKHSVKWHYNNNCEQHRLMCYGSAKFKLHFFHSLHYSTNVLVTKQIIPSVFSHPTYNMLCNMLHRKCIKIII